MINKLALHYAIGINDLAKLEAALTDLAPQIHRRLLDQSEARVRVMTLVEGASDTTPHVVMMGYKPTATGRWWNSGTRRQASPN
jgi:hypothetical protein